MYNARTGWNAAKLASERTTRRVSPKPVGERMLSSESTCTGCGYHMCSCPPAPTGKQLLNMFVDAARAEMAGISGLNPVARGSSSNFARFQEKAAALVAERKAYVAKRKAFEAQIEKLKSSPEDFLKVRFSGPSSIVAPAVLSYEEAVQACREGKTVRCTDSPLLKGREFRCVHGAFELRGTNGRPWIPSEFDTYTDNSRDFYEIVS